MIPLFMLKLVVKLFGASNANFFTYLYALFKELAMLMYALGFSRPVPIW